MNKSAKLRTENNRLCGAFRATKEKQINKVVT